MGKLDGMVAIITGGSSGIGNATVRLFVAEGAHVIIADVLDEKGRELAEELGDAASYRHVDVSLESDVKSVVDEAVTKFGRLDCIFNNAGFAGVLGSIEEIPMDGFDHTMAVLLRGVFLGMKHAAPVMKRQRSGSIISTASIAGLQAGYGAHIYTAAKTAVIGLTRSVAMELGESNVRVNCICPGGVATQFYGRKFGLSQAESDRSIEAIEQALSHGQPIPRSGLPEDIAKAALWLASDDSSFVNGHALVVDGGLTGGEKWSVAEEGVGVLASLLGGQY